ncbi:efflux RND transporter periplasmic adaptor subunit [bacterium]|nr:efflux RND transporter periplasmic adaptor subunit [bacterium]
MAMDKADLSSLKIDRESRNEVDNKTGNSKTVKVFAFVVLIFIVLAGGTWAALNFLGDRPVEVQLGTVTLRSPAEDQSILTANGYVVAQRKAAIAANTTGVLVELNVREGDKVLKKQVIGRLKDDDYRALLAEAEAALKVYEAELTEAENNLRRKRELVSAGLSAQIELEAAETHYNRITANIAVAKARIQGAEVALDNTIIRAPFAGTVLTKNADVGEIVSPMAAGVNARAAVVTVADLSSLEVEADVSESNIEKVKIGVTCLIQLDSAPSRRYKGRVVSIIPTADRAKGTVEVKIGFDEYDDFVLPEMSARVTFVQQIDAEKEMDAKPVLVVPADAVIQRAGQELAYRAENGKAVEVNVKTAGKLAEFLIIESGLSNGDRIIRKLDEQITDGTSIKIK